MSGKFEKEQEMKVKIENRLKGKPQVVNEFYYNLIGSGKSYTTTYTYINYIISFLNYTFKDGCKEDFYLEVKPLHINQYMASLRTKDVNGKKERTSDSIKTVHWSALNTFFQFLVPDYITSNPVSSTNRPKMKDNPKVTYLDETEIAGILKNASTKASRKLKNRDLCILKLGFSTGLRVSAIMQIDIDDIDFAHNQIKITEKGDHDDYVMFGENMKHQLIAWIEDRNKYFTCDTDALFISQMNERMSDDAISEMLKKYAKGVTDKKVTPHVMRHSCATNLYEKTGDIYLCAKQLHHKNVSTTQRYAELSKERQKRASNILDGMI